VHEIRSALLWVAACHVGRVPCPITLCVREAWMLRCSSREVITVGAQGVARLGSFDDAHASRFHPLVYATGLRMKLEACKRE
jgi:hypothetical protein